MALNSHQLSTGLPGLDRVFQGLRPGDNIVWQVDSTKDYLLFVKPYCENALAQGKQLIYFHFAKHEPLLSQDSGGRIFPVHPEAGFETFITDIHNVIEQAGEEAFYLFDPLTELSFDRYSDRMLGNFYMLTCPYLFALHTVAYYALLKNYHSFYAASPIAETTQILVDVYHHKDKIYVHPRKVQNRYSPTMHMLHVWEGDEFQPVTESNAISEVLTSAAWSGLSSSVDRPGTWTRTFIQAEETLNAYRRGEAPESKVDEAFRLGLRMAVTQDEKALELAEKYLTLSDVVDIKRRMISSGLIGGKAVGMLLGRAILKKANPRWNELLEPHDSFFIGSEVFYSFLVQNHCWRLRQKQKNLATFLDASEEARQRMLMGTFPDIMRERFMNLLDYFGQASIIVRSSSLLEDNFGNAFAGKYESVFCANQAPRHVRLEDFLSAVRRIYASSMSEEALTYRAERGVLEKDEQMALLVQRVSGIQYGSLYFPQVAGVALSFNPYAWNKEIDPRAGVLRLVFGLGTRAVDRTDDDYTRIVALNAPTRRPEADFERVREFAQRRVDVLDLDINQLATYDFVDVIRKCPDFPVHIFASKESRQGDQDMGRSGSPVFPWVLTFEELLTETPFASDMREMLQILQDAYGTPVDVEFTVNFLKDGRYRINLLQCRRLQIKGTGLLTPPPRLTEIAPSDRVIEAQGAVIGQSRVGNVDRLIYVVPSTYGRLSSGKRHEVARVIGHLCHLAPRERRKRILLMGPGRWGTQTPALGVPVSFREIRPVSVLCEIVTMREDLIPDVSLGTHFFNDLIETDILYVAIFPGRAGNATNDQVLFRAPNRLSHLLPSASQWADVIRVVEAEDISRGNGLRLSADAMEQRFICYAADADTADVGRLRLP